MAGSSGCLSRTKPFAQRWPLEWQKSKGVDMNELETRQATAPRDMYFQMHACSTLLSACLMPISVNLLLFATLPFPPISRRGLLALLHGCSLCVCLGLLAHLPCQLLGACFEAPFITRLLKRHVFDHRPSELSLAPSARTRSSYSNFRAGTQFHGTAYLAATQRCIPPPFLALSTHFEGLLLVLDKAE